MVSSIVSLQQFLFKDVITKGQIEWLLLEDLNLLKCENLKAELQKV